MTRFRHKNFILLGKISIISVCTMFASYSELCLGVTKPTKKRALDYQYSPRNFRSELKIPLTVIDRSIPLPQKSIDFRIDKYTTDLRIEPLQLTVDAKEEQIIDLAKTLALPSQRIALAAYFKNNFGQGDKIPGTDLRLVSIDKSALGMMSRDAFSNLFSKTHHEIEISTKILKTNPASVHRLISQMSPFFSSNEMSRIRNKIKAGATLSMDKDLLPPFARKNVGRHTVFRGPNCFHAALSFQSPLMASSSFVNVRREQGYHNDMLNYDELWRVLQVSFYELDTTKHPMQYGDMIVLFETNALNPSGVIDFKSLRHAATYLLGGYVFAKGSKSANTPYLIRTLAEEWDTWTKYTVKLGAKVYRRSLLRVNNPIPGDPKEWVY